MWIEDQLRRRKISDAVRRDLAAMRAQAMRGTLTDDEFRALRARVSGAVDPLRAMLGRLKALRRDAEAVSRFPAAAGAALDEAIRALERTLATRLTRTALERAIAARQPAPGLVHHSDRGVQYASDEYVQVLQAQQMIPSMSRPANPYDNAGCESFMKTLKREEIYANDYVDLEHLRRNIETFIDDYYNRCRVHSALGYQPPEEFEQQLKTATTFAAATMSFFRHGEDYRPDGKSSITRSCVKC